MPVGRPVGNVKGPEPNGFGMVGVGADVVAVPEGAVAVPVVCVVAVVCVGCVAV